MVPGMIMLWYGNHASIPSGWHTCDGTMGTPDLRAKFVMAAHVDTHPFYPPGQTGGAYSHDHDFTGDGHSHGFIPGTFVENVSPAGDIDHGTATTPAQGTTDAESHIPAYHALVYIMKL